MNTREFLLQLLGVTALAGAMITIPRFFIEGWSAHSNFGWVLLLLFVLLSVFLYFMGSITARSQDKYLFHGVIMGSVLIKLVLGLSSLLLYSRKFFPINNLYIWVFLLVYVVYTVWEVNYMTKLAKMK
jgi:ABC-type transport system involved in cytochrome bd biosynthesis fused ATPase/permease subunit